MKKLLSLTLLTLCASASLHAAEAGTWGVKLRAGHLSMANESDAFTALGIDFAADAISVEDKWIPEIDVTYAFSENLLAEVVLTIPQEHEVTLAGVGSLGTVTHLPPSFSLVYEFANESAFTPYLSAGLNVTWIMDEDLSVAGVTLGLDDFSFGYALGAGFKVKVDEKWDIDASVKYITIASDVNAGSTTLTEATLNPILASIGATYHF